VLTKAHRQAGLENPKTTEDKAFNERAEKFVEVLRRLRDVEWTCEGYYWLCKRKRSQLSYAERKLLADAPVIMDFRLITEGDPEDNYDLYNQTRLRAMAHRENLPVIRIQAEHTGVCEEEGAKLNEERFNGLANTLELCEEARVILIHNLAVEHGLMNGTQGTVKQIVFAHGCHPNHEDATKRMPKAVVVDFPKYAGSAFYTEPERRTWVPIEPRQISDGDKRDVLRTQFPLILGWAMTPWKAQGMTLDRVIVRLTKAASSPAVAFVAMSRVRHPDHLMLEDCFPDMATIMKQADKDSFQARQRWERKMRVLFSRTICKHLRNPTVYIAEKTWTQEESNVADKLVQKLRAQPTMSNDDLLSAVATGMSSDLDKSFDTFLNLQLLVEN
jgi:hypothetical protein